MALAATYYDESALRPTLSARVLNPAFQCVLIPAAAQAEGVSVVATHGIIMTDMRSGRSVA